MKVLFPRRSLAFPLAIALSVVSLVALPMARAITLTGSNGRAVDFHLIESAAPKGLTVRMVPDGPIIGITWDRLDLAALAKDHPQIHAAYERAVAGETVVLGIGGTMSGAAPDPAAPGDAAPAKPAEAKYPGWLDAKAGKTEFMLQLPGGKPRGILLLSIDDFGSAFNWLRSHERGTGAWGIFQTKFDMALLTYDTHDGSRDLSKTEDFLYAEKGSGKTLLAALGQFAIKTENPELADLPIAIYATDRSGTAFAYSFAHLHPDRILAASFYDGGFYDAAPSEASVKIPMLFMWGQYSNRPERWGTENHTLALFTKTAAMPTVWTNAREFRGKGDLNPIMEHFGRQYLLAMVEERLPAPEAEPPAAPADAPAPAEGTAAVSSETPAGEAPAEEAAPAAPPTPAIKEIDRSSGMIGNILTGETLKITDASVVPGEDETFVPNETVKRYWKDFVLGQLEAPEAKR